MTNEPEQQREKSNTAPPPLEPGRTKNRTSVKLVRTAARLAAICCFVGAAAIGYHVYTAASQFDDGGPPIGACCVGSPAFVVLLLGWVTWTAAGKADWWESLF